jgi:hypothetical protein
MVQLIWYKIITLTIDVADVMADVMGKKAKGAFARSGGKQPCSS